MGTLILVTWLIFFEIICGWFLVLSSGKARSICALNVQLKIHLLANYICGAQQQMLPVGGEYFLFSFPLFPFCSRWIMRG